VKPLEEEQMPLQRKFHTWLS